MTTRPVELPGPGAPERREHVLPQGQSITDYPALENKEVLPWGRAGWYMVM